MNTIAVIKFRAVVALNLRPLHTVAAADFTALFMLHNKADIMRTIIQVIGSVLIQQNLIAIL